MLTWHWIEMTNNARSYTSGISYVSISQLGSLTAETVLLQGHERTTFWGLGGWCLVFWVGGGNGEIKKQ